MDDDRAEPSHDLAALRARIDEGRWRAQSRIHALASDLATIVEDSADSVRDDEHDPEGATIAFERAQVIALLADARAQAEAYDEAEARLTSAGVGVCQRCGEDIGIERLMARPTTVLCIACASAG